MTCTQAGRQVAEGTFRVVDGPPDIPSLGAKVTYIRFFEAGRDSPPHAEREYSGVFEASTARRIWTEIGLAVPEADHDRELRATCLCIRLDGGRIWGPAVIVDLSPVAGWSSLVGTGGAGVGWDEVGRWLAGTYRVVCVAEGRLIVEDTFEVR